MDPVSITLGVIPLLGGTLSAYTLIHKKLRVFRHYSRELSRLRRKLNIQRKLFLNEIRLLVRAAIQDEPLLESMLAQPDHKKWTCAGLDHELGMALGQNIEGCRDIIDDISGTIQELSEALKCFDQLSSQQLKGESVRDTICRLRHAITVAWDKPKLERCLKDLKLSNEDLRCLREQTQQLHQENKRKANGEKLNAQLPREVADFGKTRKASKALYQALASTCCRPEAEISAIRHDVKLFADVAVEDQVRMDLVLLCYGHHNTPSSAEFELPLTTQIQVHSYAVGRIEAELDNEKGSMSDRPDHRQKRRRLVFLPESVAYDDERPFPPDSAVSLTSKGTSGCSPPAKNLSEDGICLAFTRMAPTFGRSNCPECIGFLETQMDETFRHSFYRAIRSDQTSKLSQLQLHDAISMEQVVCQPIENCLTVVDQLELAYSLVSAVLKFHSTPWLSQYFSLRDLTFFKTEGTLSKYLRTLHFCTAFVQGSAATTNELSGEQSSATYQSCISIGTALENARLQYGIRNLTLWSLGTILLQIGHWSLIESTDNVINIRTLSCRTSKLGQRYQVLTKRCLECDFGFGDDLTRPRLQQALYEKVLCELGHMIRSLDLKDD